MRRFPPLAVLLTTAAAVVAFDQATKWLVAARLPLHTPVWIVPGILSLNHVRNAGAAFSLLPGKRTFFVVVAALVLAGVAWVWWRYRPTQWWLNVALGAVVGGAIGNLIDRVTSGLVTDFIDVQVFPVWNVADMGIVCGVAVIALWLVFGNAAPADDLTPETGTTDTPPDSVDGDPRGPLR